MHASPSTQAAAIRTSAIGSFEACLCFGDIGGYMQGTSIDGAVSSMTQSH